MVCQECNEKFSLTPQELDLRSRLLIPEPRRCPQCRLKRRLAFWPFGKFNQRTDSLTGKTLVSVLSADARFPVTDRTNWHSDTWEAPRRAVDLGRSFFDQLKELQEATPHFHMLGDDKNINCDYADDVWSCKDCYYCRSMYQVENSYYLYRVIDSADCLDCTFSFNLDNCFENTYCFQNYSTHYALDSRNCLDSWFVYDCRGVRNCFMCWNLRNKQYCIRNRQLTREHYQAELAKAQLHDYDSTQQLRREFTTHLQQDAWHRAVYINTSEAASGNYLDACNNVTESFFTEKAENCRFMFRNFDDRDCLDNTGLLNGELCYETVQSSFLYNVQFASLSIRCRNSQYLDECVDCSDCFGCVGLKKKQFCILNTQYTASDYHQVRNQVVATMTAKGDYGEFFPQALMYTDYDQSFASYYFPKPNRSVSASDQRPFKIITQEKTFYQRHGLPFPQLHPDERNLARFRQMAGIVPFVIHCYQCNQSITTYYGPEFQYSKIVCEECYRYEVY